MKDATNSEIATLLNKVAAAYTRRFSPSFSPVTARITRATCGCCVSGVRLARTPEFGRGSGGMTGVPNNRGGAVWSRTFFVIHV